MPKPTNTTTTPKKSYRRRNSTRRQPAPLDPLSQVRDSIHQFLGSQLDNILDRLLTDKIVGLVFPGDAPPKAQKHPTDHFYPPPSSNLPPPPVDSLYDALEVSPRASQETITAAFRSLSLRFHPDTNKHPAAAAERIRQITAAYSILKSPERRKKYDKANGF